MKMDLTRACSNCPFRREGGIRLTAGRVREIVGTMLNRQGGMFACHKTVKYDDDDETEINIDEQQHCAGALIFADKNNTHTVHAGHGEDRFVQPTQADQAGRDFRH
jgi:hypothetical protein